MHYIIYIPKLQELGVEMSVRKLCDAGFRATPWSLSPEQLQALFSPAWRQSPNTGKLGVARELRPQKLKQTGRAAFLGEHVMLWWPLKHPGGT